MVFHLSPTVVLAAQAVGANWQLANGEKVALAQRAKAALDIACRVDRFSSSSPLYALYPDNWEIKSTDYGRQPANRVVFPGSTWVEFDVASDRIRWITLDASRLPVVGGRILANEARSLALDYDRRLGGGGTLRAEPTTSLSPTLYKPDDPNAPYCFNLHAYAGDLRFETGGAHIEIEPSGGRLIDFWLNAAPPPVAGPPVVSITEAEAIASASAAFRRYPRVPARFYVYVRKAADGVRLRVPRFGKQYATELTPYHRAVAAEGQAIPVWNVDIRDEPMQGPDDPGHFIWGAQIDARTGRCLAIAGPIDVGAMTIGIRKSSVSPVTKPASPFPMTVTGLLAGSLLKPAKGMIVPASGTPGTVLRRATVRVGKGFQTLFLDPNGGLVYAGGVAGRPDAVLLKALRASAMIPIKAFGGG